MNGRRRFRNRQRTPGPGHSADGRACELDAVALVMLAAYCLAIVGAIVALA
jgi:hypothetical protein